MDFIGVDMKEGSSSGHRGIGLLTGVTGSC